MPFNDQNESVMDRARRQGREYYNRLTGQYAQRTVTLAMQQREASQAFNRAFPVPDLPPPPPVTKNVSGVKPWERVVLDDYTEIELAKTEGESDWTLVIRQGKTDRYNEIVIEIGDRAKAYEILEVITRSVK